ncbi:MAG: TauD/TfdA family dioxygenase, partial [Actinobacteria bacterium]|nr:TauD/TfdA family dioxygenase [Actinomycetota bacterium]
MEPWHDVEISESALWRASDYPDKESLAVDLSRADIGPLIDRARLLAQEGQAVATATAEDLNIGPLAPIMDRLRSTLMSGSGIALLRGLPVDDLSQTEIELVYWGIGLCLGRPVSQSVMGERLGHVRDMTATDPHARAYRNRNELTPHTDPADLLSFLCLRPAKTGGVSRFVSSLTIHEQMRSARPDLLAQLYQGFRYHRFGEQGEGDPAITPHRIPVFSRRGGLVSCRYVRQYIEMAAAEHPEILISPLEREALDYFEAQAGMASLHVEFTLDAGEAILANNFTVLHARSSYEDHTEPELKRHLL